MRDLRGIATAHSSQIHKYTNIQTHKHTNYIHIVEKSRIDIISVTVHLPDQAL